MYSDLIEVVDCMILRYDREVARAIRVTDIQALQRAREIRSEINGFMSACGVLGEHEAVKYCRNWLNRFYD